MKTRRHPVLALLIAVALLGGCASVPQSSPAEDAAAKQFRAPADKARVYVYRTAFIGHLYAISILIDDKEFGRTRGKSFLMADLAPGEHTFVSKAENDSTARLDVQAGRTYFVWQEIVMGALSPRAHLHIVDDARGRAGVMEGTLVLPVSADK
jgi:hypothetical protein